MSRLLKTPLVLLTLIAISGCATNMTGRTAGLPASDYCRIAKPIGYDSVHDTAATVAEIEAHNSAYVCVCEHDCPKALPPAKLPPKPSPVMGLMLSTGSLGGVPDGRFMPWVGVDLRGVEGR